MESSLISWGVGSISKDHTHTELCCDSQLIAQWGIVVIIVVDVGINDTDGVDIVNDTNNIL